MHELLKNWRVLNDMLSTLREDQVLELLCYEREHEKRASIAERLHQRYNTLRVDRERSEILKGLI